MTLLLADVLLDVAVCAWAWALARADLRTRRLPRALSVPAYPAGALFLFSVWLFAGDVPGARARVLLAVAGAVGLRLLYRLLRALSPGGAGLGRGDVTLAAPLGGWLAWHGISTWVAGAWAGFAISGVVALTLLATGRAHRQTKIPHGPGMLAGAVLAVCGSHLIT